MFRSLLDRFRDPYKARPARFWNTLSIEARRAILQEEGFSAERIQTQCSKRWKKLSVTEQIWLFNPLLLKEMSGQEVQADRVDHGNFQELKTACVDPNEQQ